MRAASFVGWQSDNSWLADIVTAGAFTPTCSEQHLPGFMERLDELKSKGVSNVYVIAANDVRAARTDCCADSARLSSSQRLVASTA